MYTSALYDMVECWDRICSCFDKKLRSVQTLKPVNGESLILDYFKGSEMISIEDIGYSKTITMSLSRRAKWILNKDFNHHPFKLTIAFRFALVVTSLWRNLAGVLAL